MPNFIINKPAEKHAIKLLEGEGITAVSNNDMAKTAVDIYLPELDLYADEKTYKLWTKFSFNRALVV